ncbi:hypothetical protein SAMN05216249_1217 [Acetitomaculum ruminis DSM 5522]|uniref:Uncharacterized protein n=1 Tax=Acetitomaculum ruminis DSM 5522 TaxID=1120918 RepID=A0A1I1A3R7_9FIRM|nr:hypothetical protein [Acetitomaculum ruminis]SFB32567.1 hypothetical protein SAMN05216249_1217 [Acetitomaculum ruminis DSM 5522]
MSTIKFFASRSELDEFKHEDISIYSNKKDKTGRTISGFSNCVYLDWEYNDESAKMIIQYIYSQLNKAKSNKIELWACPEGNPLTLSLKYKPIKKSSCSIDMLTIGHIKSIWHTPARKPECIVVFSESDLSLA